jgi:hypothetical protein
MFERIEYLISTCPGGREGGEGEVHGRVGEVVNCSILVLIYT